MARYILSFLLLFFHLSSIAQLKPEQALKKLDEDYPHEKIHMFLNNEEYVAGENMWFKVYCFSGYVLSYMSTNIYVEVYNDAGRIVDKLQVPLLNGVGQGNVSLSSSLPEGVYYLRAYTRWMLNFNDNFQYIRPFTVYNASSLKKLVPKPVQWTAEAYPESGTLLAGEENKIAVRLTSQGSLPDKWQGIISEKKNPGKALHNFSSFNPQVASFYFTPEKSKEYIIEITDDKGNRSSLEIKPKDEGVLLKAEQLGDLVSIEMVFKGFPQGGLNHKLLAHMQHLVVYSGVIKKNEQVIKMSLPVKKLMNGVLHLTVFNEQDEKVAERLVFVRAENPGEVEITTRKKNFSQRALNEWELSIDTAHSLHYAYTISDAAFASQRKYSILSDLWLGDFTSSIQDPNWYFSSDDINRLPALDALLVSERWTRFSWKEIMQGNFPTLKYKPEQYLSYVATAKRNKKPVVEENLNLVLKFRDASMQLAQVKTDKEGKFLISNVAFFDTVSVFFQINSAKRSATNIEVVFEPLHDFSPYKKAFPSTEYVLQERKSTDPVSPLVKNATQALKNAEDDDNRYTKLQEVKVEAKQKSATKKLNDQLTSGLFNTPNETTFDFVNQDLGLTGYATIFDWMEGRIPGLNFAIASESADGLNGSLTTAGQRVPMMREGQVPVFVDEMPADLDLVYSLSVSDIAMIKVLKGYFVGATGGGGSGAISIYLKKGRGRKSEEPALPTAYISGYRKTEDFKAINFEDEFTMSSLKSDTRINLAWSADVIPSKTGTAPVRFFNSDQAKTFVIVVTGFTKNGKPVFVERMVSK